jgi:hypothetical protein
VSLIFIAFLTFIGVLFFSGKGHFELKSSIWIFVLLFVVVLAIYRDILLIIDCRSGIACVLECKEVKMLMDGHKSSYHVYYIDNNGKSSRIMLSVPDKRKPFEYYISDTPVKIFHTKHTKVLLGMEKKGERIWLLGRKKE